MSVMKNMTVKNRLNIYLLILCTFPLFWGAAAKATGTGWCTSQGGEAFWNYSYSVNSTTSLKPFQDVLGQVFTPPGVGGRGTDPGMACDCDSPSLSPMYFHTSSFNLPLGYNDGTRQYYIVNDYFQIAMDLFMPQLNKYLPTPWVNEYGGKSYKSVCNGNYSVNSAAGYNAKAYVYVTKDFIGTMAIPPATMDVYGSTTPNSFGGSPLTQITVQGSATVYLTCTINAGTILTVDLGSLYSSDFNTQGQMPSGYTPKTFNVSTQCNSTSASGYMTLSVQAVSDAHVNTAIQSTNPDVAVVLTDNTGTPLTPNDMNSKVQFMLESGQPGNVTLKAYPISTTGNTPAEGAFTALAYLRIDVD